MKGSHSAHSACAEALLYRQSLNRWYCLCSGRPLRGVLFWRWDLQVYAGTDPADYGVQVQDTTFDIIKENADQSKILSAQQPPNAACRVGCWVPEIHAGTFSTVNRCAAAASWRHATPQEALA